MQEKNKINPMTAALISMGYYNSEEKVTWKGFQTIIINAASERQQDNQTEIEALTALADWLYNRVKYHRKMSMVQYREFVYSSALGKMPTRIIESTKDIAEIANLIISVLNTSTHAIDFLLIDGIDSGFLANVTPQIEKETKRLRKLKADYSQLFFIAKHNFNLCGWDYLKNAMSYLELFENDDFYKNPIVIACLFFSLGHISAKREARAHKRRVETVTA